MSLTQLRYLTEMKKNFGYNATWEPDVKLKLGDVGIFKDMVFTKATDLATFGVDFKINKEYSKIPLEYATKAKVKLTPKLSNMPPPNESKLKHADTGISVEFYKENAVYFKANNICLNAIKDTTILGNQILRLFRENRWNKNWAIITELIQADHCTVLISDHDDSKIELKANSPVSINTIDLAEADNRFSVEHTKGLNMSIISALHLTPLYKLMGMKSRIFFPPILTANGLQAFDLVTPKSASNEHRDYLYFGYLSDNIRE